MTDVENMKFGPAALTDEEVKAASAKLLDPILSREGTMADRRHVHLRVTIMDPGEWCDDGRNDTYCRLLRHERHRTCVPYCSAGHVVDFLGYRTRRPQSCRDAVIGGSDD